MEFNFVILRRLLVFGGVSWRPSEFLEQLDFVESPNLRIQVFKANFYLCVCTVKRFMERNKAKVSAVTESYQKGYLAAKTEILKFTSVGGKA